MERRPSDLRPGRCAACEGGVSALAPEALTQSLAALTDWQVKDAGIERRFRFRNFYESMAFVNAIAWIAAREDHHPDLQVGYDYVLVRFQTHSVGGVTENDILCAQAVDALIA